MPILFMAPGTATIARCVKGHRDIRHFKGKDGLWTCSACGKRAVWSDSWGYSGSIECRKCWCSAIDFVACSDACQKQLARAAGAQP
jgi:hypothetical protein